MDVSRPHVVMRPARADDLPHLQSAAGQYRERDRNVLDLSRLIGLIDQLLSARIPGAQSRTRPDAIDLASDQAPRRGAVNGKDLELDAR